MTPQNALPKKSNPSVAARVIGSLTELCQSVSGCSKPTDEDRTLRYESLEDRCVLSANALGLDVPQDSSDSQLVSSESLAGFSANDETSPQSQQSDLTAITVRVNDDLVTLNPADKLQLAIGDRFEVVGIAFDSNAADGVFAVEGYINKIQDGQAASLIDYNDGRFSSVKNNFSANGGNGSIDGLSGAWVAETGWDRMTLSLIHYMDSDTAIASRALIQLEVGKPDFAFDEDALSKLQNTEGRVGEKFEIHGSWTNFGAGTFHNYAEVDVYHSSNPDEIVWAGALVGNASESSRVEGYFINSNPNDRFTETFTPDREGGYVFRFYLDPEHVVAESNESNNRFDVKVNVAAANAAPVANADAVETRVSEALDKIDVLANDFDSDGDPLVLHEVTQPEHGKVSVNQDGTLAYTPDQDFTGTDNFQYSITDGDAVSELATVQVEVLPGGFAVNNQASGNEDTAIAIEIKADPDRYTHVRVSNVPDGANLSHGRRVDVGSYDVRVKDLDSLTLTPPANSDDGFSLTAVPFQKQTAFVQLTENIEVNVNAAADGGHVDVADFAIVTGASGSLPFRFGFSDLDGSERHTVTFDGLPDFISLSAGEKIDGRWVLEYEDLAKLQIRSERLVDTNGFLASKYGDYQRYEVNVSLRSVERSGASIFEDEDSFTFLAIQRP